MKECRGAKLQINDETHWHVVNFSDELVSGLEKTPVLENTFSPSKGSSSGL